MAYADQEMSGNRVISIVIVALLHVAFGYALVTGLAYSAFEEVVERVTTVDIEEPEPPEPEEEPPPPPPEDSIIPPPPPMVVPRPPININPNPTPFEQTDAIPPRRPVDVRPASTGPTAAPPAPPAPPATPNLSRGAERDGFNRWASRIQEAYPSRAIRQEIEGNVGVSVVIGTNGRVQSCTVTGSSGEKVLDDAACAGMERYARYEPAKDRDGNPTTGRDSLTIVYQLN